MSVVALVGNGLSIAYNAEMSVPSLTEELLRRFDDADDELRAIAAAARQSDTPEFEQLLGPFDAVSAMIRNLPGIRNGGGWVPRFDALGLALEAAQEIHSRGTGLALNVIAERSQIQGDFLPIDAFCSAIAELDDPSSLTIATLNYDGLLAAGFLQEGIYPDWTVRRTLHMSDMGDGRTEEVLVPDFAEGRALRTWELRRIPDFMPDRARLLNLHGSLGWLRDPHNPKVVRKFRVPDLRDAGFWAKHSRGETAWEPVVVLTSRKTELTEQWPFLLCYSELTHALTDADRWLIVGYGLADDPINLAFKSAVRARQRRNQESQVLTIGRGHPRVIRTLTREKLGIPADWITASGDGLPDAIGGVQWQEWAA